MFQLIEAFVQYFISYAKLNKASLDIVENALNVVKSFNEFVYLVRDNAE